MEKHLSLKTNELFDLQDRIFIYDLSNTYFEGVKSKSELAQYGRSKEKRSDCKIVVLDIYSKTFGCQIANVTITRFYGEIFSQIILYGFGLCGWLNDYQIFTHNIIFFVRQAKALLVFAVQIKVKNQEYANSTANERK